VNLDAEKIKEIFTDLEFRNLAKRVIGEEIVVTATTNADGQMDLFGTQSLIEEQTPIETTEYKTIVTEKAKYHLITNEEERNHLRSLLLREKTVCFDTETTNIEAIEAELVGIAFSFKAKEAYYVACPPNRDETQHIVDSFKEFFESETIEKIGHNLKYDIQVLKNYGMEVKGPLFDTMIAHYLIQPEAKQSMDFLSEFYLKYKPISIETLLGKKGKNQGNMRDLDAKEVYEYACEDADITLQLKQLFEPEIQKEHLKDLFYKMEMPLMLVLCKMEREGIAIDIPHLQSSLFV
jgi:DNA polymerase I